MEVLKRAAALLLALLTTAVLLLPAAPARADRYRVLDAALSMLEEGNPFLVRYNAETCDTETLPPFGGVIVSILDVPAEAAPSFTPEVPELPELTKPCFDLEGYHLEILDLSAEKRQRWIRWRKRPGE